jgi:hypothetical protein
MAQGQAAGAGLAPDFRGWSGQSTAERPGTPGASCDQVPALRFDNPCRSGSIRERPGPGVKADDGSRTRDLRLGKPRRRSRRLATQDDASTAMTRVSALLWGPVPLTAAERSEDVWATIGPRGLWPARPWTSHRGRSSAYAMSARMTRPSLSIQLRAGGAASEILVGRYPSTPGRSLTNTAPQAIACVRTRSCRSRARRTRTSAALRIRATSC